MRSVTKDCVIVYVGSVDFEFEFGVEDVCEEDGSVGRCGPTYAGSTGHPP